MNIFKPMAKSLAKAKNQISIATSCLDEILDSQDCIQEELAKPRPDYVNIQIVAHQQDNINDLLDSLDILENVHKQLLELIGDKDEEK